MQHVGRLIQKYVLNVDVDFRDLFILSGPTIHINNPLFLWLDYQNPEKSVEYPDPSTS